MGYRISPEELIDITIPLSDATPAWPGDVRFGKESSIVHGFRTSKLTMSSHCGTHIDAPAHLASCCTFVNDIPLSSLILPAVVVDCEGKRRIGKNLIEEFSLKGKAILLKTINEPRKISDTMKYSYLTATAADLVVRRGVKTVGIDTLSVDAPDSIYVHEILLNASVPILENLLLKDVHPGNYLLICLPLKIESGDGSPVRAFLQPILPAGR
jgi:arylformamidase